MRELLRIDLHGRQELGWRPKTHRIGDPLMTTRSWFTAICLCYFRPDLLLAAFSFEDTGAQ